MPNIEYRLFFNDEPATRDQLGRVDKVTVTQTVNRAWEGRLEVPLSVDDQGSWQGEDEAFMQAFGRARVEVRIGEGAFKPLIDGPIVGDNSDRSPEPGESSITLRVQDDSVFLNREESLERFDNRTDSEIAAQLFSELAEIAVIDVEDTPPPASSLAPSVHQRGTAMSLLRRLAERQGKFAYVLPGEEPGQSIACFKSFPTEPGDLPAMVLLGRERNIDRFNSNRDAQRPARVRAYALDAADRSVLSSESRMEDLDLLGPEQAVEDEQDTAYLISPPYHGDAVDLDQRVAGEQQRASFDRTATGSLLSERYQAILQPYQVVQVRGVDRRLSGNYQIHQVIHTLSGSQYTQSFTVKRNARSSGPGSDSTDSSGRIF